MKTPLRPVILIAVALMLATHTIPAQAQKIGDEAWLDAMEWRLIGPWRGGRVREAHGGLGEEK